MNETAEKQHTAADLFAGQAVQNPYGNNCTGYIVSVAENDGGGATHIIGGGGMEEITKRIKIVFVGENPHVSDDVSEQQALTWAARGAHLDNIDPKELPWLITAAAEHREKTQQAARLARTEADIKRENFVAEYGPKIPKWAKGVIVATLHINDSDPMTDYAGYKTGEQIILGFSKHERDLFPELRKAAARATETAHLATKPTCPEGREEYWTPDDEHREKYSMGHGFYLGVYCNSDGWVVQKRTSSNLIEQIPIGRWAVPSEVAPVAPPLKSAAECMAMRADTAHIEEHTHTKRKFQMFMVIPEDRVERGEYLRLVAAAKLLGGWYSRAWRGTPGGYGFDNMPAAERFLAEQYGDAAPDPDNTPAPTRKAGPPQGEKFRTLADTMQTKIDAALAQRQENTPKRMAQAAQARLEGRKLERTQTVLRALAALHDAGEVPEVLAGIRNRTAVYDCMASKLDQVPNGFHTYAVETGEPRQDDPLTLALWAMLDAPDPEREEAEALQRKISALQFVKIPGYFPTPDPVIDIMLEHARIEEGHRVLEPELGSCAIADRVAALGATVKGFEVNYTLAEICQAKGYLLKQADFLTVEDRPFNEPHDYDRVMMNPPFENLQDCTHVMHAHRFLRSGGRLVAVMGPGWRFHNSTKAEAFRDWMERNGGEVYDLPEGSFKASGTGVNSLIVVIDKA